MKRKAVSYSRRDREYEDYQIPLKMVKKEKQKRLNKKITSALKTRDVEMLMSVNDG
jgi:hypothetical protein